MVNYFSGTRVSSSLRPNKVLRITGDWNGGGDSTVASNRRNIRVTASIINTTTGETTSHMIMANTEGDFH